MNLQFKNVKMIKLTKIQISLLQKLSTGSIINIDSRNMASVEGKPVAAQTRYFLTANRFIERIDKKRAVSSPNNGFIISEKGRLSLNGIKANKTLQLTPRS